MTDLSQLFGQPLAPMPQELQQAMGNVQGNISQLLSRANQGPSLGDLGHAATMAASTGGRVPYTEFLNQAQGQQYQNVANQAGLVNTAFDMYLNAAKAKAQSNPLAAFYAKGMEELLAKDPQRAMGVFSYLKNSNKTLGPDLMTEAFGAVPPTVDPALAYRQEHDALLFGETQRHNTVLENNLAARTSIEAGNAAETRRHNLAGEAKAGTNGGGPTAPQTASNAEIKAARKQLDALGVTADQITEAANPNAPGANPELARLAHNATQHLVGENDPEFDAFFQKYGATVQTQQDAYSNAPEQPQPGTIAQWMGSKADKGMLLPTDEIQAQQAYDKLPSGAIFTGPDGHTRKKP